MSHTPGPWIAHGWGDAEVEIVGLGDKVVCEMAQEYDEHTGEGLNASINEDARLIAAAPEMLKQLRAVRDDISALCLDSNGWRDWDATAVDELLASRLVRLDDLITKAEGRTE